jgi:hypothetical protein
MATATPINQPQSTRQNHGSQIRLQRQTIVATVRPQFIIHCSLIKQSVPFIFIYTVNPSLFSERYIKHAPLLVLSSKSTKTSKKNYELLRAT